MKRDLIIKLATAAVLYLLLPASLTAAELEIQLRTSGQTGKLEIRETLTVNYFDLGKLAGLLGGSLGWEIPAERITWDLEGVLLSFEDRLSFFTVGENRYQLVDCCLIDGGQFLVPVQLAVEFLPRLFPERFSFSKLENRLVDKGGKKTASWVDSRKPKAAAVRLKKPKTGGTAGDLSDFRIHTVVIDPGHGGKDPGALGRRYKLQEKEIVLEISRKVAEKLKKKSKLKVILTRSKDNFIQLGQRGRIANEKGAGLFVSIHVNAQKSSRVRGTSTYFLDAARTDEERATAMLENASLKYEVEQIDTERLDEVNLILQDMAQNEFLRESQELSSYIHRELVKRLDIPDNGVRQAGFAVLRGAFMPVALVETAYISNPGDEKLLRSKKFRDKAAEAISRGILAYIEQYHKKLASGM